MKSVCFNRWKKRRAAELADIERAKDGKIYPAGCTLYPLDASSPDLVQFLPKDGPVSTRYAVIDPRPGINRRYFFLAVKRAAPEFAHKYQSGINMQYPILTKRLTITYHEDKRTQDIIADSIARIDAASEMIEKQIEAEQTAKKRFLQLMFVGENINRPGKS